MSKPFFSVVILSFNRPKLLKRALDSVAKQTFKDFEVVVVDASKNNEPSQISCRHKTKPRCFKMKDKGIGVARDFGLRKAKGEWTAFLDDDDEYLPEHLEVRKKIIDANPKPELIYNGFKTIGSKLVPDLLNPGKFLSVESSVVFHAGTAVMKTKKAKEIGGFKKANFINYPDDFYAVALKAGLNMHKIVNPRTYLYHRHKDSYTGKLEKEYRKQLKH